tara:strand:+ start:1539 stop:2507 length:969 start_codon:yes stop_codon:yes gene_type:complete
MEIEQQNNKRFLFEESKLYKDVYISNNKTKYYINKQLGYGSYANIFNISYSITNNITDFEKRNSPRCIKVFKKSTKYTEFAKKEVEILSTIKHPTFFVSAFDAFMHEGHFCIIFNKYDLNLYQYIKKCILCKFDVLLICKQLLKGLVFMNNKNIIHGDLKPENILVNVKNDSVTTCAICDFNLAIDNTVLIDYKDTNVSTLWYRAPEIYLDMKYSYEIDIWAFGCILYELISGKALFRPKCTNNNIQNNKNLYELHLSFIGKCPFNLLEDYGTLNHDNKISFDTKIFKTGYQTIFSECIKWDPKKRMLPEGCLKYIRQMIQN